MKTSHTQKSIIQKNMAKMIVELGEKGADYTDELLVNEFKRTKRNFYKQKTAERFA